MHFHILQAVYVFIHVSDEGREGKAERKKGRGEGKKGKA